jgi:murein DD-endopeptidase MepM/ murein hydrolase activator NlpD
MLKDKGFKWGKKSGLMLTGLVLGGLALLAFLALGSLDMEDPWLTPSEKVVVVAPKSGFTLKAGDRDSGLKEVRVTANQGGQDRLVLSRTFPPGGEKGATVEIPVALDPKALGLKEGKATFTVTALDRSWRNFFKGRSASQTWDAEVSLVPISVSFVSVSHLMSQGGTGFIVYRVNKTPKESGIRLGDRFFPGYPLAKGGEGLYGAFFAIPVDAPAAFQAELIARAGAGNEAKQSVPLRFHPKRWRQDKMNLSEGFLQQVAAKFPESNQGDLLKTFLEVNQKKRQANHDRVRQVCATSQSQPLWTGAFQRYQGKPMARFGDRRTYVWQNRGVDEQVHQGEDLASLINSPVPATNNGLVVLAEPLGIYGNTVILDHGMGVFSMYSHLSRIDVKTGERVEKGKAVGLTGTTGLAAGDHLHYSVLVHGYFVNPLEWWDAHWYKDQVEKVAAQTAPPAAEAGQAAPPPQAASSKGRTKKAKKRER